MGRIYGGILGVLAFQTSIVRGWIHHNDPQSILWTAWLCMIVFAGFGMIIGRVAAQVVRDSVTGRVNAELAAQDTLEEKRKKNVKK